MRLFHSEWIVIKKVNFMLLTEIRDYIASNAENILFHPSDMVGNEIKF